MLVSFDVVSLFTRVPVDFAVKVAHEWLSMNTSLIERMSLSADQVVQLLQFCLDVTFLAYRGDFYQQTFDMAMGSPVSVTVANLVMEDVEQRALSSYLSPPPFWKRYVDNTAAALRARGKENCSDFISCCFSLADATFNFIVCCTLHSQLYTKIGIRISFYLVTYITSVSKLEYFRIPFCGMAD